MSIETIYVDSSDEITSVIERLKASHEPIVALVVPKGAALVQSIVNLKLAKKAAGDAEKDLILVTSDSIGRNLAAQVGIAVASSEKDAKSGSDGSEEENTSVIAGVRIHRYYDGPDAEQETVVVPEPTVAAALPAPAIVPKALLQEEVPVVVAAAVAAVPKPSTPSAPLTRTTLPEAPVEPDVLIDPLTPPPVALPPKDASGPIAQKKTEQKSATPLPETTPKKRNLRTFFLIGGIVLVIALLSSFFFLPITTVTLAVQAKPWDQQFVITGNVTAQGINDEGTVIPAERLKEEGEVTASFPATGTKRTGVAAKGTAKVFNSQDSSAVNLPAGARIEANGRTFTTDAAVSVPGVTVKSGTLIPGSATVAITAENVGSESNVSGLAANITSPATSLYAQIESTTGGSSQELKIVSASDITNAKNTQAKLLRESLVTKLNEQTATREVILLDGTDLLGAVTFTTSLEVNAEGDSFQATSKGALERLVVDKASTTKAIENFFASQETATEKRLIEGSISTATAVSFEAQTVTLTAQANGKITPVFATADLSSKLVGKSLAAGQALVAASTPASSVTITQSSWWPLKQFPRFAGSITIKTTYE
jgi:hypothetical protein